MVLLGENSWDPYKKGKKKRCAARSKSLGPFGGQQASHKSFFYINVATVVSSVFSRHTNRIVSFWKSFLTESVVYKMHSVAYQLERKKKERKRGREGGRVGRCLRSRPPDTFAWEEK